MVRNGTLVGHSESVNSAQFSTDGKFIVTASSDRTAKEWSTNTYEVIPEGTLEGRSDIVHSAQYSPDGKHIILTAFENGTVKVWNKDIYWWNQDFFPFPKTLYNVRGIEVENLILCLDDNFLLTNFRLSKGVLECLKQNGAIIEIDYKTKARNAEKQVDDNRTNHFSR